jgi:hypothetical protein
MRRYLASLALVASVAAAALAAAAAPETSTPSVGASALAARQIRVPVHGLRDEGAMVLIGTALISLAAAVRRAA